MNTQGCVRVSFTFQNTDGVGIKGKVIIVQAVEALRVARGWDSHFSDICQPYAPAAFYPQQDSWYSFLLEPESTPGP
jgi:hypothetical protein